MIGDSSGQIRVYDNYNALIKSIPAHSYAVERIKQLPNGYVATCDYSTIKIWDPSFNNWTLIQTFYASAFDYINNDLMISATGQGIKIWSIKTGETVRTINGYYANSLKMLDNGIHVAIGGIYVININTGSLVYTLNIPSNDIIRVSNGLFASSSSQQIYIWSSITKTIKFVLNGHNSYVYGLKMISSDILASGSDDKTIKLWNITDGTLIRTLTGHTGYIYYSIDSIDDGQTLLSAAYDGTIRFWDWKSGQVKSRIYTGLNSFIYSLTSLDPIKSIICF